MSIVLFVIRVEKLKNLKLTHFQKIPLVLSISCSKCANEDEKLFKEEKSTEILKNLSLIKNI